jgi:hypothetical protein
MRAGRAFGPTEGFEMLTGGFFVGENRVSKRQVRRPMRLQTSRIRQEHRPIRYQLSARLTFRKEHTGPANSTIRSICRVGGRRMRGAGVNRRMRSDFCRRLTADVNSSYSPAVARLDAMRNQATIASFRIAAEAGGVAAHGAEAAHAFESGHHGWLNRADSHQCEHGYNRFLHRASLHSAPRGTQHFRGRIIRGRTSFAVN